MTVLPLVEKLDLTSGEWVLRDVAIPNGRLQELAQERQVTVDRRIPHAFVATEQLDAACGV